MAARWWALLLATGLLGSGARGALEEAPAGCRRGTNPLYYALCGLKEAWGIVLEALAALGLGAGGLLLLGLLVAGCRRRVPRARLALRAALGAGALGLFALLFAFAVRPHPANCGARRFLFGALFGLCFASLAAQAGGLAYQARSGRPYSGKAALLAAGLLLLAECLFKTEWLLATTVRGRPLEKEGPGQNPCHVAKKDFVASLVYVMALLASALLLSAVGLCCRRRRAKRQAAYILVSSALSVAVWAAWIAAYLAGDRRGRRWRPRAPWYLRRDAWDDPPLGLALVVNAWVLVLGALVPWLVEARRHGEGEEDEEDEEDGEERSDEGFRLRESSAAPRAYADNKAFDSGD
ncbi:G-protein coupled receptor family C group 5 member C-like, partial [Chiloscyllium plagiosum]|uniref:G-protein coupled receptor family C group 5 member C-like n=1 Tax=Chiloscyllium plagiosum TaxID=36176 RepID=UPI001CB83188